MASGHGTGEDGDVLGAEEVVDGSFEGGLQVAEAELLLKGQVTHVVGLQTSCDVADLVAGGCEALAVGVPLIGERPRAPLQAG